MWKLKKAAIHFSSGTLLSRMTGLVRDLATAFVFGTSPEIAAFLVAYRFANLMRRLFGETPLSSSFIPHFEGLKKKNPEIAQRFYHDFFLSFGVVLIGVICIGELVLWLLPWYSQIVDLTMLMLPGLYFICLFGLNNAYLQCENRFFYAGFAPAIFNAVWVVGLFFMRSVHSLAVVVVIAFFLQWAFTLPKAISFRARPFSRHVRKILWPFMLGILGIGASQINSAIDPLFARFASLEGPAYLWYAIRMQQLPLALVGISLSTVILPAMSRSDDKATIINTGLKDAFFLLFPATLAIFVLGGPGVNLLYGRGQFSGASALHTTHVLWAYGLGLIPMGFSLLLSSYHYAQKNYRAPAISSAIAVGTNITLNALMIFVFHWGAISVALATSISAFINCLILWRPTLTFPKPSRIVLSSGLATITASLFLSHTFPRDLFSQVVNFLYPAVTFTAITFAPYLPWRRLARR